MPSASQGGPASLPAHSTSATCGRPWLDLPISPARALRLLGSFTPVRPATMATANWRKDRPRLPTARWRDSGGATGSTASPTPPSPSKPPRNCSPAGPPPSHRRRPSRPASRFRGWRGSCPIRGGRPRQTSVASSASRSEDVARHRPSVDMPVLDRAIRAPRPHQPRRGAGSRRRCSRPPGMRRLPIMSDPSFHRQDPERQRHRRPPEGRRPDRQVLGVALGRTPCFTCASQAEGPAHVGLPIHDGRPRPQPPRQPVIDVGT